MQETILHIACGASALAELAAEAAVLDADERARAARLRFDADRELYRAAHVLLRRALSLAVPLAPAQWRFVRGPHGRPEIDTAACPDAAGLRFNLTHTRGLVCCALAWELPVGIDAECHRPMQDARAIAERFFAAEESAAVIASGAPGSPAEATTFRALWTLKEAYIKALGRGLSMGLDGFAFRLVGGPPARIELRTGEDVAHPASHWCCLLLRIDDDLCTLAAAVPGVGGMRFQVVLHAGADAADLTLAAITPGSTLLPVQMAPTPMIPATGPEG